MNTVFLYGGRPNHILHHMLFGRLGFNGIFSKNMLHHAVVNYGIQVHSHLAATIHFL